MELYTQVCTTFWPAVGSHGQELQTSSQMCRQRRSLTFEELTNTFTQVEACLNSRPLTAILDSNEGIEVLTPGHFLIGSLLEALPDPPASFRLLPLLRQWQFCQALTHQLWKR